MDTINLLNKAKSLHLVSSRLLEGLLSGNYRTVFRGPGIEFDEVREYVESDDARNIDWNVSSRMGSPFTKTYREERERLAASENEVVHILHEGAKKARSVAQRTIERVREVVGVSYTG